jgi:hypothetical protein
MTTTQATFVSLSILPEAHTRRRDPCRGYESSVKGQAPFSPLIPCNAGFFAVHAVIDISFPTSNGKPRHAHYGEGYRNEWGRNGWQHEQPPHHTYCCCSAMEKTPLHEPSDGHGTNSSELVVPIGQESEIRDGSLDEDSVQGV